MKRLRKKYLDNTITKEELLVLCQYEEKTSDENLEKDLLFSWLESDAKKVVQEESKIAGIEKEITEKLKKANRYNLIKKGLKYVALLVGPFLMLSILLLCLPVSSEDVSDTIITTKKGERVNVVLPDGTHVILNSDSELRYNTVTFHEKERTIQFNGEAFFEVKKNEKVPFVIESEKLKLEVLGTDFNFQNRKTDEIAKVFLKRGLVLLSSKISKKKQKLLPNEEASFDKRKGVFKLCTRNKEVLWLENKLLLRKVKFLVVLKKIEQCYDVVIEKGDMKKYENDVVTVVLPLNDIQEVMRILSRIYKKRFYFDGKKIYL